MKARTIVTCRVVCLAALCVSLVLALSRAAGSEPASPVDLARLCSRIENDHAGARTGLLDQLASLLGHEGHALRLDMRTLERAAQITGLLILKETAVAEAEERVSGELLTELLPEAPADEPRQVMVMPIAS